MAQALMLLVLWAVFTDARSDCFERAGQRFRLNANLLRAIAEQESRYRPDAVGPRLAGGNRAIGMMQVNTIHLPELSRHGITKEHLFTECGSVFVGAWILAHYVASVGPTWRAVGVYNTGPASKNIAAQNRYIAAVQRRFNRLERRSQSKFAQGGRTVPALAVWSSE